jgi:hypothetical protein
MSRIVQAGNNTNQTLFRNNTTTLATSGAWGSKSGLIGIYKITIQGNWDGSSDITTIPPVSGKGTGKTGILKAEYSFDSNAFLVKTINGTKIEIEECEFTRSYGHTIGMYHAGYSRVIANRANSCRGSMFWCAGPSKSTSTRILENVSEVMLGEQGSYYLDEMVGSTINNNLSESAAYGIYVNKGEELDILSNYCEASYFEDIYQSPECWGVRRENNYEHTTGSSSASNSWDYYDRMSIMFSRHKGYRANLSNATYTGMPYEINQHRFTYGGKSFSIESDPVQPERYDARGYTHDLVVSPLTGTGGSNNEWYTSYTHKHYSSDDQGRAELRFKRNGNQNGNSGLGFVTRNAAGFAERWEIDQDGDLNPSVDGSVDIGTSASQRVRDMRIVNAPIVGSDYRIKKDIKSISQEILDFAINVEIMEYKLRGRNRSHYGIVITEEFLSSLSEVTDLDLCAAFCRDVFTDSDGNPIMRLVNGVELGDLWQVRYDEWQNIMLEAIRRKINSII